MKAWGLAGALLWSGCGVFIPYHPPVPHEVLVEDAAVEAYAVSLMQTILAVTPHAHVADGYRLHLARLGPWRELAGAAAGGGIIYLDYGLARAAFDHPRSVAATNFAMVVAHEVAHEVAGHVGRAIFAARYAPSWNDAPGRAARELEADRLAIGYWGALGWECGVWIRRFEADLRAGRNSVHHPTDQRLSQARALCGRGRDD